MDRNKEFRRKLVERRMEKFLTEVVSKEILDGKIFMLINADVASYLYETWDVYMYQLSYMKKPVTLASTDGDIQGIYIADKWTAEELLTDMLNRLNEKYPEKDYAEFEKLIGISIGGDITDDCKVWKVNPKFVYGTMDLENVKNVVQDSLFGAKFGDDSDALQKVAKMMPIIDMMNKNKK